MGTSGRCHPRECHTEGAIPSPRAQPGVTPGSPRANGAGPAGPAAIPGPRASPARCPRRSRMVHVMGDAACRLLLGLSLLPIAVLGKCSPPAVN